jgi:hypothetical protein
MDHLPPSEGERRALGGYVPQYLIASKLVITSLLEGEFEWIRLVDPEAGRLDDIQIGTPNRVDAYQIKWSQYEGAFTFRQWTQSDNPPLIAQLVDGWQRLKLQYPNRHVVVHLLTNDYPSVNDELSTAAGTSRHFAAFVRDSWLNIKKGNPVDTAWQEAWNELHQICGLPSEEFQNFVQACELDFRFVYPLADFPGAYQVQREQEDLQGLSAYLMEKVARSSSRQPVQISRREIIRDLHWSSRFEYRNRHSFPVDENRYVPIQESIDELSHKLENLSGGYLAIVGSAGSGKSSLLTRTLEQRPERLVKYYAYVPDDEDTGFVRGEAQNFFADINLTIQKQGISRGKVARDRREAIQQFQSNLELLSRNWRQTGVKTILLIDGLDHIPREQSPRNSLLSDLPLPNRVPEGVYLVLGTRDDQLADLALEIRQQISEQAHRVEMQPLSREAVIEITTRFNLPVQLTDADRQRIFELSEGHPLALDYILRRFQNPGSKTVQQILREVPNFDGDIRNEYEKYWEAFVRQDIELKKLLGLIARMRRAIDIDWLENHFSQATEHLVANAHYFFKRATSQFWYFHHSSFRVFLEQKTALTISGNYDPNRDSEYHQELAQLFAASPKNHFYEWEQLYHYVKAGNATEAMRIATPQWFRDQLISYRPINSIQTDITHSLQLSADSEDVVSLTRLLLTAAEFQQRDFHLDLSWLAQALLDLDRAEVAISYVRQGQILIIEAKEALEFAGELWHLGFKDEAHFIFSLAEPLNKLTSNQPISSDEDIQGSIIDLLRAWTTSAIYFRPLDQIIAWIRNLRREAQRHAELDEEESTQFLQARLLYDLGSELQENNRNDDFRRVLDELDLEIKHEASVCFWLHHKMFVELSRKLSEEASLWFAQLRTIGDQIDLHESMKLALAEGAYRIIGNAELAKEYLKDITQPPLQSNLIASDMGIDPFDMRFQFNRLLYALGERHALTDLVPNAENDRDQGLVYFERGICALSHVWGKAWANVPLLPSSIQTDLQDWVRFYYRNVDREWMNWYIVRGAQADFFELMIDSVAQHGMETLNALYTFIVQEWETASDSYWPLDVKRSIILAFIRHDLPIRTWAIEQLNNIESQMYRDQDISGQIDACKAQFEAWLAIGDASRAGSLLKHLLLKSFGVGYRKDYQLNSWIRWLPRINTVEPHLAIGRIKWFAEAINTLDETTEGRASYLAARELIPAAYEHEPSLSLAIFRWFIQQGLVTHEAAIAEVLKKCAEIGSGSTKWIVQIFGDFLLRFSDQDDLWDDLEPVISSVLDQIPREEQTTTVEYLVRCVETYALSSHRLDWRHILAKVTHAKGIPLDSIGLGIDDLDYSDPRVSAEYLILSDGTHVSSQQVKRLVTNTLALQNLLNEEAENSYFDWSSVLSNISSNITLDDVEAIVQTVITSNKARYRKSRLLLKLARRLDELGNSDRAWELARISLEYAEDQGRYPFYSSTRLDVFALLIKIDAGRARHLAWEDFRKNVIYVDVRDYLNLATNLDDILDVLCTSVPVAEVWREIERYVHDLLQTNLETAPSGFDTDSILDITLTPEEVLANLLVDYLGHPVPTIAKATAKVCAQMLLIANSTIATLLIKRHETSNDVFKMHLVSILHTVGLQNQNLLQPFKDVIGAMAQSSNLMLRVAAVEIATLLRLNIPKKTEPNFSLPPIYQLAIPQDQSLIYDRKLLVGDILPDTQFASQTLILYEKEILQISRMSGFPVENIQARVIQVMNDLQGEIPWKAESEEALRDNFMNTGIRLSYVRPRHRSAYVALGRVMGELYDAQRLPTLPVGQYLPILNFYDPQFVLLNPEPRPKQVEPIQKDEQSRLFIKEEWRDQIGDEALEKTIQMLGDFVVVGEFTKLKVATDGNPTEIRRSQICVSNIEREVETDLSERFFERITKRRYSEYEHLTPHTKDASCVIHHFDYGYISQCGEWLAFNPLIARKLGWVLSVQGLFRWTNEAGETMVESIWWNDSTLAHSERILAELGEGWLVLASPKGWSSLVNSTMNFVKQTMVERQYFVDSRFTRNYRTKTSRLTIS